MKKSIIITFTLLACSVASNANCSVNRVSSKYVQSPWQQAYATGMLGGIGLVIGDLLCLL